MIHEVLNIEEWIERFPLSRLRNEAREFVMRRQLEQPEEYKSQKEIEDHIKLMMPSGDIVRHPEKIAVIEQLRREALGTQQIETVPTDIFLFASGESSRREVTKFGGLPYWPKRQEWPRSPDGTSLTFIGQFCFKDSQDIVGDIPNDILLVFGPKESEYLAPDESDLQFFWCNLNENDLIEPSDMPQVKAPVPPSYGVIYRTVDYPGAKHLFNRYKSPENLAVLEGTKIGGVPRWIQGPDDLQGRFLCALGSISFLPETPYPFVNRPEPVGNWDLCEPIWGDVGSLYIFLTSDGLLDVTLQCY